MIEVRAIYSGLVQGVFFRATVKKHAEQLNVAGTVCNRDDGTVELWAMGSKTVLEKLLLAIEEDPGAGKIKQVKTFFMPNTHEYIGFKII